MSKRKRLTIKQIKKLAKFIFPLTPWEYKRFFKLFIGREE